MKLKDFCKDNIVPGSPEQRLKQYREIVEKIKKIDKCDQDITNIDQNIGYHKDSIKRYKVSLLEILREKNQVLINIDKLIRKSMDES